MKTTNRILARIKALPFAEKRALVSYLQHKLRGNGKMAASKCMRLRHDANMARDEETGEITLCETCLTIKDEFLCTR